MKRKMIAIITTLALFVMITPGMVFAVSGSLQPEDVRLLKAVSTDEYGNVIYVGYYDRNENLIRVEEANPDDPSESYKETNIYDEAGNLLECITEYYDGNGSRMSYQYNENHQLSRCETYSLDGELQWTEDYTYDASGNMIRLDFQTAEGQQYVSVKIYNDSGQQVSSIEKEKENFESAPTTWTTATTYHEIDDLSWSATTTVYNEEGLEDYSYTESWRYDDHGNLLSSVEFEEGELYRTTFTYGSNDQLLRVEAALEDDPEYPSFFEDYHYRSDGLLEETADSYNCTTKYLYTLKQFDDVEDTEYFAYPVKWAVDEGITSGMTPEMFGPYENCTRAQAVTFLWRAAGEPEPTITENPFQDVQSDDYYCKPVLWAVQNGITNGLSPDTFGPAAACDRGQIVTFLYRFKGETGICGTVSFSDVTESDYFYGAVLWAVADGVTNGTSDTTFSPGATCTRGQIVTFLQRTMSS